MAHFATELFIQCVYSLDLSYHEMMDTEAELKLAVNAILERNGAGFIHFEELGDTLRVQCVFNNYEEDTFHAVCDDIAPYTDKNVEARLLFVNKDLNFIHYYSISEHRWKESCIALPPAGPVSAALLKRNYGQSDEK